MVAAVHKRSDVQAGCNLREVGERSLSRAACEGVAGVDDVAGIKRLLEIIDIDKILQAIVFRFSHSAMLDHFEDHLAEVSGGMHAPLFEDGQGHQAELLDGQNADSFQEFLTGNVCFFLLCEVGNGSRIDFLSLLQRFENEIVSVWVILQFGAGEISCKCHVFHPYLFTRTVPVSEPVFGPVFDLFLIQCFSLRDCRQYYLR